MGQKLNIEAPLIFDEAQKTIGIIGFNSLIPTREISMNKSLSNS